MKKCLFDGEKALFLFEKRIFDIISQAYCAIIEWLNCRSEQKIHL